MADKTVRGRFVWHELMTPDTAGAHAFYSKALGWKTQPWDQDPSYSMFAASSGPLGGSVALPTGAPHWLHYVGTPDIDATIRQATGLGARITKDLTEMSSGGKYAVLADPQGAAFAVYWSAGDHARETPPKRGEFSWHELATADYKAAFDFYSALFGWERAGEHDMGELGMYFMFGRNGAPLGGMFNKPAGMPGSPFWLGYVRVKNVHQSAKKVKSARGSLVNGPMEVPGGDWIAQFTDPYGAMFAIHAQAADMKAASEAGEPAAPESAPEAPAAAKPAAAKPAAKSMAETAIRKKATGQKAAGNGTVKKASKKKTVKKKTSKKKAAAGKRAGSKKRRSAAKSARRPARKAARATRKSSKKSAKKRGGGRKKLAAKTKRSGAKQRSGAKKKTQRSGAKKKATRRPRRAK